MRYYIHEFFGHTLEDKYNAALEWTLQTKVYCDKTKLASFWKQLSQSSSVCILLLNCLT